MSNARIAMDGADMAGTANAKRLKENRVHPALFGNSRGLGGGAMANALINAVKG